jgi:hypothetical protein
MLTGIRAMLMENARVADTEAESVTLTVKFAMATTVGVPEIWPEEFRLSPAGSEPEATDHE